VSAHPAPVRVEVTVTTDVARTGAATMATAIRDALRERSEAVIAVSGGETPWAMFAALGDETVPWDAVTIWQADERIVPRGHPDRGLDRLEAALPPEARPRIRPMPVEADADGVEAFAATLPDAFDLIHLGLGEDGHTASLVPGDPVLEVDDRAIAITQPYRGHRRMTMTYPAIQRARQILWLVTGAGKAGPLRRLIARDPSIPGSWVGVARQRVIADPAAAGRDRPDG
jgi:6-phosphogluconolactonase